MYKVPRYQRNMYIEIQGTSVEMKHLPFDVVWYESDAIGDGLLFDHCCLPNTLDGINMDGNHTIYFSCSSWPTTYTSSPTLGYLSDQ